MIKKYKSINEEINRIKSLFTEERMFGNLVEGGIREGVIKTGSKPDVVKPLQRLLKVKDDGIFGPETKEALMKFQSDNGLEDDGIAGEETVKVLNKKFKINESNYSVISEDTQSDLNAVNAEVAVEVGEEDEVDGCTKGNCLNGYGEWNDPDMSYKGNFDDGDWNGYGFYKNNEGGEYKGFFKDGSYDGIGVETEDGVDKMGYFEMEAWKRDLTDEEKVKLLGLTSQTAEAAVNALATNQDEGGDAEGGNAEGGDAEGEQAEGGEKTHQVGKQTYTIKPWNDISGDGGLADTEGDDIDYWVKVNKDGVDYGYRKKFKQIYKDLDAEVEKNTDIQQKEMTIKNDVDELKTLYVPINASEMLNNVETTISDLETDLDSGKSSLKETFSDCKDQLTAMSKISSKMGLQKYKDQNNDDPTATYKFCVGKFHSQLNRWDKLRGSKSSINQLRDRWFSDIDHEELKVKGGTLGQKYDIMNGSTKMGVVIKKGRDEYRIRTKMGKDIVTQDQGKAEFKNSRARRAVEKAISMPDDKMIVLNKKLISKEDRIWASFTLQDRV